MIPLLCQRSSYRRIGKYPTRRSGGVRRHLYQISRQRVTIHMPEPRARSKTQPAAMSAQTTTGPMGLLQIRSLQSRYSRSASHPGPCNLILVLVYAIANQDHTGKFSRHPPLQWRRKRSLAQPGVKSQVLEGLDAAADCGMDLTLAAVVSPRIQPLAKVTAPLHCRLAGMVAAQAKLSKCRRVVHPQRAALREPVKKRNPAVTLTPHAAVRKDVYGPSARAQHPSNLATHSGEVWDMLHHLVADHDVESVVRKRYAAVLHAADVGGEFGRNVCRVVPAAVEHIATRGIDASGAQDSHDLAGAAPVVQNAATALSDHEPSAHLVGIHGQPPLQAHSIAGDSCR